MFSKISFPKRLIFSAAVPSVPSMRMGRPRTICLT